MDEAIISEAIRSAPLSVAIARGRLPRELSVAEMRAMLAQITGEVINPLAHDEREQDLFRGLLTAAFVSATCLALCLYLREHFTTTAIVCAIGSYLAFLIGYYCRPVMAREKNHLVMAREKNHLAPVLGLWSAGIAGAITLLAYLRPPPVESPSRLNPAAQATLSQIVTSTFLAALAALILGCLAGWLLKRLGSRRLLRSDLSASETDHGR